MALNLQEKTDILEIRTDSLENLLGRFISAANRTMVRLETDTRNLRDEIKLLGEKLSRSDSSLAVLEMNADTKALKKELIENSCKFSDKLGTLAYDMMAPSIPGIAQAYFGDDDFASFAIQVKKKRAGGSGEIRDFDAIAESEKNFYVNDTKSSPSLEYVNEFAEVLADLPDYFPQCRNKRIIPIFSSPHIPDNVLMHLTRHGIYAMGLKEDSMELLNFDQVEERLRK